MMKWIGRMILNLVWFLVNIPTVGIPYLIYRWWTKGKVTDNSEECYLVTIQPRLYVPEKIVVKALRDISIHEQWIAQFGEGTANSRDLNLDDNNMRKFLKYVDKGVFYSIDVVFSRSHGHWINTRELRSNLRG